jgi:hypothetical protein
MSEDDRKVLGLVNLERCRPSCESMATRKANVSRRAFAEELLEFPCQPYAQRDRNEAHQIGDEKI